MASSVVFAGKGEGVFLSQESEEVVEAAGLFISWSSSNIIKHSSSARYEVVVQGVVYMPLASGYNISQSSEYVLDALISNGFDAVLEIKGHYCAFVIDKEDRCLKCFGDPDGGRHVYYSSKVDVEFVSTKIEFFKNKALGLRHHNDEFKKFALVYGFFPFGETVYQSVKKLLPGSVYSLNARGIDLEVLSKSAMIKTGYVGSREMAKIELNDLLLKTCEAALRDYDSVAVLLGGFDSAFIAAMACKLGKKVKAYTFKYEDAIYDQANIDSVIKSLGIDHEWVRINSSIFEEGLSNYSSVFDRPTNWPNYVIQSTYLAGVAKKDGAQVILTGDGCDEAFLGYPGIYRGAKFFSREYSLFAKYIFRMSKRVLQIPILERELGHAYRIILRVFSNLQLDKKTRLYLMFRIMDENTLSSLYGMDRQDAEREVIAIAERVVREVPGDYSDTILAYEGRENIIPNKIKLTGMMDSTGVPVYSPFLHPEVKEYVRSFPEEFLRPSGEAKRTSLGKYILLEMAEEHGYLPYEVIYQPKHAAVDGPLDSWYANDLRGFSKRMVGNVGEVVSERFLDRLLDEKLIDKVYRRKISVDNITSHAASLLVTYGAYFED